MSDRVLYDINMQDFMVYYCVYSCMSTILLSHTWKDWVYCQTIKSINDNTASCNTPWGQLSLMDLTKVPFRSASSTHTESSPSAWDCLWVMSEQPVTQHCRPSKKQHHLTGQQESLHISKAGQHTLQNRDCLRPLLGQKWGCWGISFTI